jgi:hypothetical protein
VLPFATHNIKNLKAFGQEWFDGSFYIDQWVWDIIKYYRLNCSKTSMQQNSKCQTLIIDNAKMENQ